MLSLSCSKCSKKDLVSLMYALCLVAKSLRLLSTHLANFSVADPLEDKINLYGQFPLCVLMFA